LSQAAEIACQLGCELNIRLGGRAFYDLRRRATATCATNSAPWIQPVPPAVTLGLNLGT
jgi:hypothetical protein